MMPRDYRTTGDALTANIDAEIEQHPDSFECLVYLPDLSAPETVAANQDVVGSFENSERAVTYLLPTPARAKHVIEGPFFREATDAGDAPDGVLEQPLMLVLNLEPIPKHSVIQFEEWISSTEKRLVSLWVERSDTVGSIPGGKERHYCIPFHGFDGETP